MATVTFDQATRVYRDGDRPAIDRLDLEIHDGEFLVLVGPSGCGKSTTLRMLAGLEPVDYGEIRIGDRDVTVLPPKDRDIAMVFQSYALYRHDATVDVVEELGSESYLNCTDQGMEHQEVVVRTEGLSSSQRGDQVSLVPKPEAVHLFDTTTGMRLADA